MGNLQIAYPIEFDAVSGAIGWLQHRPKEERIARQTARPTGYTMYNLLVTKGWGSPFLLFYRGSMAIQYLSRTGSNLVNAFFRRHSTTALHTHPERGIGGCRDPLMQESP